MSKKNVGTEYRAGEKIRQSRTVTVRAVQKQERVLDFILSTECRDRYNTEVSGWKLKNYRANPAVTWAHMYNIPLIGNALRAGVDGSKRLVLRAEFTPPEINQFGYEVYEALREGWMRTFSAGFVPEAVEYVPPSEEEQKKGVRGFYKLKQNDLLEGAVAPVPANPECTTLSLMQRSGGVFAEEFAPVMPPEFQPELSAAENDKRMEEFLAACRSLTEWHGKDINAAKKTAVDFFAKRDCEVVQKWEYDDNSCRNCGAVDENTHALDCENSRTQVGIEREQAKDEEREQLVVPSLRSKDSEDPDDFGASLVAKLTPEQMEGFLRQLGLTRNADAPKRGVIPFKKQKLADLDAEWNAGLETAAASIDDLWEMSAWFAEAGEKKGDYKLIHHTQNGYRTVWAGVKQAMARLNGGRGGVNVPSADKARVFRHLSLHYGEFKQETPELKAWDEKGAAQPCTPELFYRLAEGADSVSEGGKPGGSASIVFARHAEGAEQPNPVAEIVFRARELEDDEDSTVTRLKRFLHVAGRAWEEMSEEQREAIDNESTATRDNGWSKRVADGIHELFAQGFRDIPAKSKDASLECVRVLKAEMEAKGLEARDVAATTSLTVGQVNGLLGLSPNALHDAEQAVGLRKLFLELEGPTALAMSEAVLTEAFDADVVAQKKSSANGVLLQVGEWLASALDAVRNVDGAQVLRADGSAATTRSEEDEDADDVDGDGDLGLASQVLDDFLGSGSVDAARRLRGRKVQAKDSGDGDGQNQPADNADLLLKAANALLQAKQ